MSLDIQTNLVRAALLPDGWHEVADQSFDLDAYEFLEDRRHVLRGGQADGVPSIGFYFHNPAGNKYMGPLTSILAVLLRDDEPQEPS